MKTRFEIFSIILLISFAHFTYAGGVVISTNPMVETEFSEDMSEYSDLYSQNNQMVVVDFDFSLDFSNTYYTESYLNSDTANSSTTPSTIDPVSTVSGNMYHDETDIIIKGRGGLNIVFTRTYNSLQGNNERQDDNMNVLGERWTHSYNMRLLSNDFGQFPEYSNTAAPENTNSTTSSITYLNERGGEINYLVKDVVEAPATVPSYAISPPPGHFDTLAINTPSTGMATLTFRNGNQYIFESYGSQSDFKIPGTTARLKYIKDPYGNQITLTYNGSGKLVNINDNLSISGRSGLVLAYNANNKLASVTDWTTAYAGNKRIWSYGYESYAGGSKQRLTSMTNPLDDTITYSYIDQANTLLKTFTHPEDRNGKKKTMTFAYYNNDKAFDYVDTLGQREILDYDLYRKRTRITHPRGTVTEHHYNNKGALEKLRNPDGGYLLFENNQDGLRYAKTNAIGYETKYSYHTGEYLTGIASNTGGKITREQDALGNNTDYSYSTYYGQIKTVVNKNGSVIINEYYQVTNIANGALAGKLKETRIKLLGTHINVVLTSATYYADGNLKQQITHLSIDDPTKKRVTDYYYKDDGLNVDYTETYALATGPTGENIKVEYQFDDLGRKTFQTTYRKTSATDPALLTLTTEWRYDKLGRVIVMVDPADNKIYTDYDANGQVTTVKRHVSHPVNVGQYIERLISSREYDAADRLTKETNVFNKSASFEYDAAGNITKTTDANNHSHGIEYDAANRPLSVTNANGYKLTKKYDLAGNLIAQTNAKGETVQFKYDALKRLTEVTSPDGRSSQNVYDAMGQVLHVKNANLVANASHYKNVNGYTLSNSYDELGRLLTTTDAANQTTRFEYDLAGNTTAIINALAQKSEFVFDELGRLVEEKDPLAHSPVDLSTSYTHDELGNVLTRTDRNGETTRFTYDILNRLVKAEYLADGTEENFIYDHFGDLVEVNNQNVSYVYTYDDAHRLKTKTDSRLGKTLEWTYDDVGNVRTKTDYEGNVTTYTYDSSNRLVAAQNPNFLQASYFYDGAGRLINRTLSNGSIANYQYDQDGRLSKLSNKNQKGELIFSQDFTYDEIGNITQLIRNDSFGTETVGYTYDALYRLENVDSSNDAHDITYTYDAIGNRLKKIAGGFTNRYCYDDNNRLLKVVRGTVSPACTDYPINSYEYDNNGSRTVKRGTGSWIIEAYTYDQKRRISSIADGASVAIADFQYDPSNYRISKQSASIFNKYLLEGEHLEATYDGNNADQLKNEYFRGPVVDEIINGYEIDGTGKKQNQTFYHDHLNSIAAIGDHKGGTLQSTAYGPFGEVVQQSGTANNDMQYTGREADQSTGLYYYRARYYDPEVGRFITEDPLGFGAGINFYAYVANNPLASNDPSGELPNLMYSLAGGAIGFVAGGIGGYYGSDENWDGFWLGAGIGATTGLIAPWASHAAGVAAGGGMVGTAASVTTDFAFSISSTFITNGQISEMNGGDFLDQKYLDVFLSPLGGAFSKGGRLGAQGLIAESVASGVYKNTKSEVLGYFAAVTTTGVAEYGFQNSINLAGDGIYSSMSGPQSNVTSENNPQHYASEVTFSLDITHYVWDKP